MSAFGTSELAILKETKRFGETRYVCDVEKMIREIMETAEAMFSETARYPCSLHISPRDYWYLRADKRFCGDTQNAKGTGWLLTMRVFETSAVYEGSASLSICPGCLSFLGSCANKAVFT